MKKADTGRVPFGPLAFEGTATSLMAGVTEEVAFKELPITYMARQWRDEKKIPLMIIIPGLAFGLTHITNIFGSKPTDTLAQVVLSIFFGIFFSAVYVRTGSIWTVLIGHTLHDLLVSSAAVYTPELPDRVIAVLVIIEGILAVYGMYLIRKKKRPEIMPFGTGSGTGRKRIRQTGMLKIKIKGRNSVYKFLPHMTRIMDWIGNNPNNPD